MGSTSAAINEYFFGIFYFIGYGLVHDFLSTFLMSSNIITYLSFYQVFSHVFVLVLHN